MKKILPEWCKEAKKALIDRDMNVSDLAKELNYSRYYISNVINGTYISLDIQKRICNYLGVSSE